MIVAGIGCRRGVCAVEIEAAIDAAFAHTAFTSRQLGVIAVPLRKQHEMGIHAVAAARGIPLTLVSQPALQAADAATLTRSARSMAAMHVHCVAEAAALAAAGPRGRLLAARIGVGPVTCALAEGHAPA